MLVLKANIINFLTLTLSQYSGKKGEWALHNPDTNLFGLKTLDYSSTD